MRFPRGKIVATLGVVLVLGTTGSVALLVTAGAGSATTVAPVPAVSPTVLDVLNADQAADYTWAAPGTTAAVPEHTAITTAEADAPWSANVTGASLVNAGSAADPAQAGRLVWLVSVQPDAPVYPIPPGRLVDGVVSYTYSAPAYNVFAVAIDAETGSYLDTAAEYNDNGARATAASVSGRKERFSRVNICGHEVRYRRRGFSPPPVIGLSRAGSVWRVALHSGIRIIPTTKHCAVGSNVTLRPKGAFKVNESIPAFHHRGTAAVIVTARKLGSTTIRAHQRGKLIGQVTLQAVKRGDGR